MKEIFSWFLFLLGIVAFLSLCFKEDGSISIFGIVVLVALIAAAIWLVIRFFQKRRAAKLKEAEREIARAQYREKQLQENAEKERLEAQKISKYQDECAAMALQMGSPDKVITLEPHDLNKEIRAYSTLRKVVILGKEFDFSSILSCNLTDDSVIKKGDVSITTTGKEQTDDGDMLGRSIVGGMLAGGAGAIIGGVTARKDTVSTSVVQQGKNIIRHDYSVWITVKDIANPMIQIVLGKDEVAANEILSLMKAIMASNAE